MSDLQLDSTATRLFSLPETRKLSWIPIALECAHQLVLACWVGGITVLGFMVTPNLYRLLEDAGEAAWVSLDLTMQLNFISAGAGSFLLLITLVMYLLTLRGHRTILVQMVLLLGMTSAAVANHVWIAPQLSEILRQTPNIFTDATLLFELEQFDRFTQISLVLQGVQVALGSGLLFLGVRKWYRYIDPPKPQRLPELTLVGRPPE